MRRVLSSAALAIFALSAPVSAQRATAGSASASPEVGMDAAVSFDLGTNGNTSFDIPAQRIRMGFFVSPELSIEPTLGLHRVSGTGSVSYYEIGAGVLYHFSTSRAARQFYARPFLEVQGISVGGGTSNSNTLFGIGGGMKVPLRDRIASRFEANFAHGNGRDFVGLLAGLSFYTR